MKRFHFYFILILLNTSCDCVQYASGYVLDYKTKTSLSNVALGKQTTNPSNLTDSMGYFEYRDISGGLFGCPNLELHFSKEGYKTYKHNFKNWNTNDTIYLIKTR